MSHDYQVTTFWTKVLTVAERERLVRNVATSVSGAADFIQRRVVSIYWDVPNLSHLIRMSKITIIIFDIQWPIYIRT